MDITAMKERLEKEKELLESELATVGRKNPKIAGDWEPMPGELDPSATESDELADKIEDFEENTAIVRELEIRLADITSAIEKVDKGTYGVCEECGEEIEEDRLQANPAARTCKKHMGSEESFN
jgi:RNA polymerase-binding transcription factor DksA